MIIDNNSNSHLKPISAAYWWDDCFDELFNAEELIEPVVEPLERRTRSTDFAHTWKFWSVWRISVLCGYTGLWGLFEKIHIKKLKVSRFSFFLRVR